jgi:hypothetical protein
VRHLNGERYCKFIYVQWCSENVSSRRWEGNIKVGVRTGEGFE